jgi:predicted lipid-binding transport protein (Tim44 family)
MNSEGFPYADIIILALIAGFVLLRLRSVLGNKNEGDDAASYLKKIFPPAETPDTRPDTVVQLDERSVKPRLLPDNDPYMAGVTDTALAQAIGEIKARDPQFTATGFLQGARGAFEMVFDAFAKGDKPTLKMLMSDAIFQHFAADIDARDALPTRTENTLVSVTPQAITSASFTKSLAQLSVHFASEQVSLVRDARGDIIEGDPSHLHHV